MIVGKYADYLFRYSRISLEEPMGSFLAGLRQLIDSFPRGSGYQQNRGKQGLALSLEGEWALACKRRLRGPGNTRISGSLQEQVRY